MTPTELYALLKWAPQESALAASLRGGVDWVGWTIDTLLLRTIAHATTAAVSKKPPKPPPLPRSKAGKRIKVSQLGGAVPRRKGNG